MLAQEELDLKPGHSFLEVGSGCGIIAACAAFLVRLLPLTTGARALLLLHAIH